MVESTIIEAIRVGGLVAVVAILLVVLWMISKGRLVPGATHNQMREGYRERIEEIMHAHEADRALIIADRDWYRERLLAALDLAEGLVEEVGSDGST